METQTSDESLPLQRVRGARRQRSVRRPMVRELVSERDKTHRILGPTITSVQLATQETKSRNPIYSSIFEVKQATQTAPTDAAANPFEEHKVPKPDEWGSAPSRGGDDVYKGKGEERLFDGNGRVTVPSGLSKRAGGKKDNEDEKPKEGLDGGGEHGSDDGNDGGDEEVNVAVEEQAQDSESDDGLTGYVNAEDDEAWFVGGGVGEGEVLFRGDYQKRLGELGTQLTHLAQVLDEQTEKEDNDWLDKLDEVVKSLQVDDEALPHRFEKLLAMLRYQPSRRLSTFRKSPTIGVLERFIAELAQTGYVPQKSRKNRRVYEDVIKHCDLIFEPKSLMARQIGSGSDFYAIWGPPFLYNAIPNWGSYGQRALFLSDGSIAVVPGRGISPRIQDFGYFWTDFGSNYYPTFQAALTSTPETIEGIVFSDNESATVASACIHYRIFEEWVAKHHPEFAINLGATGQNT